ncbi:uncharacterized protein LOC125177657, partial [Hyalella azteca]|uniref:Uncharacterized protein LOC125177657 n=1 Tax=Hyalella azteca TaxID=294128 RepID=A0A979FFT2_HYAAZ
MPSRRQTNRRRKQKNKEQQPRHHNQQPIASIQQTRHSLTRPVDSIQQPFYPIQQTTDTIHQPFQSIPHPPPKRLSAEFLSSLRSPFLGVPHPSPTGTSKGQPNIEIPKVQSRINSPSPNIQNVNSSISKSTKLDGLTLRSNSENSEVFRENSASSVTENVFAADHTHSQSHHEQILPKNVEFSSSSLPQAQLDSTAPARARGNESIILTSPGADTVPHQQNRFLKSSDSTMLSETTPAFQHGMKNGAALWIQSTQPSSTPSSHGRDISLDEKSSETTIQPDFANSAIPATLMHLMGLEENSSPIDLDNLVSAQQANSLQEPRGSLSLQMKNPTSSEGTNSLGEGRNVTLASTETGIPSKSTYFENLDLTEAPNVNSKQQVMKFSNGKNATISDVTTLNIEHPKELLYETYHNGRGSFNSTIALPESSATFSTEPMPLLLTTTESSNEATIMQTKSTIPSVLEVHETESKLRGSEEYPLYPSATVPTASPSKISGGVSTQTQNSVNPIWT